MGLRVSEIGQITGENAKTLHSWKRRDGWDRADAVERIGGALEARLMVLIAKPDKSGGDYKEIDLLHRQLERQARIQRYQGGGRESDLNPERAKGGGAAKGPARKNTFTDAQVDRLKEAFLEVCFPYQTDWYRASSVRTRILLKSRQIGATYYFALEALLDAITSGRNQLFLSASKSQAFVFRNYMRKFVQQVLDVDLKGMDLIVLGANAAEIRFLGTNTLTAQSYNGNFYFDEFFWTHRFTELNALASAMASHKHYRQTYFSTPSSMSHEAYPFWTGDAYNEGRPKADQVKIDVTHTSLADGRMCEDFNWRQIVTVRDAERRGCTLFDIEDLERRNNPAAFANLYMCDFVDDHASIFPMAMLQPCFVDSWVAWAEDFKPFAARPFGDRPVWIGYDPAETGDNAGLVVLAPPQVPGGKFRVLERHQFQGMDFSAQAAFIEQLTRRYWVTYIGIDITGMGTGVAQLVRQFFPGVTTFSYSPEIKTRLVLKAYDVIHAGRLEFDASCSDLAQSLMAITRTTTASGRQLTFTAGRNQRTGHADLAWALFHALHNEPLEGQSARNTGFMEIS